MVLASNKLVPFELEVCISMALTYWLIKLLSLEDITLVWLNKLNLRGKIL